MNRDLAVRRAVAFDVTIMRRRVTARLSNYMNYMGGRYEWLSFMRIWADNLDESSRDLKSSYSSYYNTNYVIYYYLIVS